MSTGEAPIPDWPVMPLPPVCVILYEGTTIISRLIRVQTRGSISHAALLFEDGTIYEAREGRGVIKRRWGQAGYPDEGWTVLEPTAPEPRQLADKMREYCEHQIGKKYDYLSVLRFITRRRKDANPDKLFCSEMVVEAFELCGFPLFLRCEPFEVSPSTLLISPRLTVLSPHRLFALTGAK